MEEHAPPTNNPDPAMVTRIRGNMNVKGFAAKRTRPDNGGAHWKAPWGEGWGAHALNSQGTWGDCKCWEDAWVKGYLKTREHDMTITMRIEDAGMSTTSFLHLLTPEVISEPYPQEVSCDRLTKYSIVLPLKRLLLVLVYRGSNKSGGVASVAL